MQDLKQSCILSQEEHALGTSCLRMMRHVEQTLTQLTFLWWLILCVSLSRQIREGNGNPLQCSCLENPVLEKEMATHSSVLAWRIPGTEEPVGCRLWGRRVGHDWRDLAAASRQRDAQITDKMLFLGVYVGTFLEEISVWIGYPPQCKRASSNLWRT